MFKDHQQKEHNQGHTDKSAVAKADDAPSQPNAEQGVRLIRMSTAKPIDKLPIMQDAPVFGQLLAHTRKDTQSLINVMAEQRMEREGMAHTNANINLTRDWAYDRVQEVLTRRMYARTMTIQSKTGRSTTAELSATAQRIIEALKVFGTVSTPSFIAARSELLAAHERRTGVKPREYGVAAKATTDAPLVTIEPVEADIKAAVTQTSGKPPIPKSDYDKDYDPSYLDYFREFLEWKLAGMLARSEAMEQETKKEGALPRGENTDDRAPAMSDSTVLMKQRHALGQDIKAHLEALQRVKDGVYGYNVDTTEAYMDIIRSSKFSCQEPDAEKLAKAKKQFEPLTLGRLYSAPTAERSLDDQEYVDRQRSQHRDTDPRNPDNVFKL